MRLACVFALIALAALVLLTIRLDGATATIFSFIGFPSLAVALGLYALARHRRANPEGID
jgi:hypothetical protein